MSHRMEDKQARREARLRADAEASRRERRQALVHRGAYAAVAMIAAALITLAVTLGGTARRPRTR